MLHDKLKNHQDNMTLKAKKLVKKKSSETHHISLTVNGHIYELSTGGSPGQVEPSHTLAHTLRETLGLTGTKVSCDSGACGCCTVLMEGKAILSCMTLTIECDKKSITTIEGLRDPVTGSLDPLQQAFIDHTAFQCGFCTPGIIMSAKALLARTPSPTEEEVKEALSGNFCRCISHYQVIDAMMAISKQAGQEK
jgi:aerobic carbon-monoxide dehydrogenase small subunit